MKYEEWFVKYGLLLSVELRLRLKDYWRLLRILSGHGSP